MRIFWGCDGASQYVIPTTVGRRNLKDEISHYVRNDVRAYHMRYPLHWRGVGGWAGDDGAAQYVIPPRARLLLFIEARHERVARSSPVRGE